MGQLRGENDNPDRGESATFAASRMSLALPVIVIALGYALLVGYLAVSARAEPRIGQVAVILLSVGVPFVLAYAVLRALTVRVQLLSHAVIIHSGFPRAGSTEIPYGLVIGTIVRRGLFERLAGAGTVTFELTDGTNLTVTDIAEPHRLAAELRIHVDRAEASRIDAFVRGTMDDGPWSAMGN